MGIHEQCERIVANYVTRVREEALGELSIAVARCMAALRKSGRLPVLATYDREWIVEHVDVDIARLLSRIITEQDIEQMIDEALAAEALPPVPPVSLPDQLPGEIWEAVEINEQLYCFECRSMYEGKPLTEAQMNWLREEGTPFCAACGCDL
jgi:hypothetical protein